MAESQYGGRDLSGKASEIKDKATDQFKRVADRVEGLASDAVDHMRDTGAGQVAGNIKGAVDKSVKDQPMVTLAMVAAVGFVLGALWKSSGANVFAGLINQAKSAASQLTSYVARASVAVPFVIVTGFALAAVTV